MNSPSAEARITDLRVALAGARTAIARGDAIDLTGLDDAVDQAMAAATAAPEAERGAIVAALHAFIDELELLASAMFRSYHAATAQQTAAAYGVETGPANAA